MRLVSAAKIPQSQRVCSIKILQLREVTETMELLLAGQNVSERRNPARRASSAAAERVPAIVICGDRGLCGGFNSNPDLDDRRALQEYKEAVELVLISAAAAGFFRAGGVCDR